MIELEKKLLLTKDEYDCLMENFGYKSHLIQKPIVTQINYYFDTDDFWMNRQNVTCRIRLKDKKYKAIMKQHSRSSDRSTETEMKIHTGLDNNAFTDMGLKLQGALITKRCVILKDTGYEVVLDKNEYLGHTDYELEVEYVQSFEHRSECILNMIINSLPNSSTTFPMQNLNDRILNTPSKSTRFFKRRLTTGRR